MTKSNGSNNLRESMTIACDSFPSSNALFHFKISVATIKFTAHIVDKVINIVLMSTCTK